MNNILNVNHEELDRVVLTYAKAINQPSAVESVTRLLEKTNTEEKLTETQKLVGKAAIIAALMYGATHDEYFIDVTRFTYEMLNKMMQLTDKIHPGVTLTMTEIK